MYNNESDRSIVMIGNITDKILQLLFHSHLFKYQIGLKQTMKARNFIFNGVSGMHYLCNEIIIICGVSYINSPKWIKSKDGTIKPKIMMTTVSSMQQWLH